MSETILLAYVLVLLGAGIIFLFLFFRTWIKYVKGLHRNDFLFVEEQKEQVRFIVKLILYFILFVILSVIILKFIIS